MKRRSATSSRPPEPIFIADENLGRVKFPQRLRDSAVRLEIHLDHFSQGAPDDEWLPEVGKRGWVLLTLDTRLRYNRLEQHAIMENDVAAFVLVGGNTHEEKAVVFLEALERIRSFLARHPPPFIAKVYRDRRVTLWLSEAEWRQGSRQR